VPELTRRIFGGRDCCADALGQFHFEFGRRVVAKAAAGLVGNGGGDRGMGVAQNRGAVRADVVDEAVAVGVEEVRAFAARDKGGRLADRLPGADRGIDGAGSGGR
jgi:hypothetical protein